MNIKKKYYEMASYFLGIDIGVIMTSKKVNVKKKFVHFGIPISRNLLKTIKRFLKVSNKARIILYISMRLFNIDFFLQIPMQ
jgi:hypothetical protein